MNLSSPRTRTVRLSLLALAVGGGIAALALAGPLDPPAGPIAPTYKTLTEVEPRTAISAANTPGTATALFRITQPGSYYLTGNITGVIGKIGIEIAASGVTLDLMGFDLVGLAGSLDGVNVSNFVTNIAVVNGSVRSWAGDGVDVSNADNSRLTDLRASGNTRGGLRAGSNTVVIGCSAQSNGSTGISAGNGCTTTNCSALSNTGAGFSVGIGSTITNCSAQSNTNSGINTVFGCTITNCSAQSNTLDGIRVTTDCTVRGNTCDSNGNGGDGAGIHATGGDNRIEDNNCTRADRGIDIDIAGNIIIRNTCSGNTINWTIAIGNSFGPIVVAGTNAVAVSGNSAASTLGSTDPNANFSY